MKEIERAQIDLELSHDLYEKHPEDYQTANNRYVAALNFVKNNIPRVPRIVLGYMLVENINEKIAVRKAWNYIPRNHIVDVSYWNDKINKQESDNVSYVGINMYEYENYKETLKSGDIPVEENERGIVNILKKNNYRIIFN